MGTPQFWKWPPTLGHWGSQGPLIFRSSGKTVDAPSTPSVLYDLSAIFTLWTPAYGKRSHICNGKSALYLKYAASILQFGLAMILTTEELKNLAHDFMQLCEILWLLPADHGLCYQKFFVGNLSIGVKYNATSLNACVILCRLLMRPRSRALWGIPSA